MNKVLRRAVFFGFSFLIIAFQSVYAQQLYVGSAGQFFLKNGTVFTTSDQVVNVADSGMFIVEAGNSWGTPLEFVDGTVKAIGSGTTLLPTGDNGVFAPVNADLSTDVTARYYNQSPTSGSLGMEVDAVADIEYWEMTGKAIITLPWNDQSGITDLVNNNGGKLSSVAVVGLNGTTWELVSAPKTNTVTGDLLNGTVTTNTNDAVTLDNFSEFTFGIDHQAVLAVDDLFGFNNFNIVPNPVRSDSNRIDFTVEEDLQDLQITIFDITGRKLKEYKNIRTSGNIGSVRNPNLKTGIYFVKFVHENKQGVKKIIIN
jgi:hypothetical protein